MFIRSLIERKDLAAISLACVIAAGIWVWALWPRPAVLTVTFLSVGQGDAVVVETPGGHAALIDAGPGPSERDDFDAGAKVVAPFLRRRGINRLDAFVLTHPHEDHVGGAPSVIRSVGVASVLDPGIAHPSGRYRETLELIKERRIPYRVIHRGHKVDFHDGVTMEVLNPPANAPTSDDDSEINNLSAAIRIEYRGARFLLTGDAEKEAESEMLSTCDDLSAQVLKVGHPSPKTVERLQAYGIKLYRTDQHGGVTVTTDGRRISVSTTR